MAHEAALRRAKMRRGIYDAWVWFGSKEPDTAGPQHRIFGTAKELAAYSQGLDEAIGWSGFRRGRTRAECEAAEVEEP